MITKPAAVGEGTDLEPLPGHREQAARGRHRGGQRQHDRAQPGTTQARTTPARTIPARTTRARTIPARTTRGRAGGPRPGPRRDLGQSAGRQDDDQPRPDGRRGQPRRRPGTPIQRPCAARVPGLLPPARRQLAGIRPTAAATATAGTAAPDPAAAPAIQPGGRGARNRAASPRMMTRPGTMKQTPPRIAPGRTAQPPGAEDGQLGRGRAGQQVAGGQPVLEVVRRQPLPVRHAQLAQQRDVRGRAAEPDAADPAPFPGDRGQRDGGRLRRGAAPAQRDQARGQPTQRR